MPEIAQPLFPLDRRVFFSVFHDTPLCRISQKSQNCIKYLNNGDGGGDGLEVACIHVEIS